MAKYIKFNCINTAAVQPQGTTQAYLVPTSMIATVTATGLGAVGNAKTVVVGLGSGANPGAGSLSNPGRITVTVTTNTGAAANPVFTAGSNKLVQAVQYAITANPGGIVATVALGLDNSAVPVQMYWRSAAYGA
jgi:hypothetical protein